MNCKKCHIPMKEGVAIGQTWKPGRPDFYGDLRGVTLSPGGPGRVISALKCPKCGYSVTNGPL